MNQEQLTITTRNQLLKIFLIFFLAVAITFCGWSDALAADGSNSDKLVCLSEQPSNLETELRKSLGNELRTDEGCPEEMGAWYMLPMPKEEERMQAVHAALLPDNTVLIANGSSNRNRVTLEDEIEDGVNTKNYDVVNNTSIFDPSLSDPYYKNPKLNFKESPFTRIDSPPTPTSDGESNDLFCSGHLQLPNGDVLFIGGTRLYYPGVRFLGSKQANIYHWRNDPENSTKPKGWESLGQKAKDGHWYPTLVPLADGEIAAFSGLSATSSQDISPFVEIYDPKKETWQSIYIKDLDNNPFKTPMNAENSGSDIIDLYSRILPTKEKNRFLITGDGGGKNNPLIAHASVHTYFVIFTKNGEGEYSIKFEPGPDREAINKVYGTALLDPSSSNGDVLLLGGILGTNNIGIGPGKDIIKGASIAASLERWKAPTSLPPEAKAENKASSQTAQNTQSSYWQEHSSWDIDEDFLANIDEDILQKTEAIVDGKVKKLPLQNKYVQETSKLGRYGKRAMEQAVILPTKEVLVVNGGNYAEVRPAYNPTLLIPDPNKPLGFRTKLMNPDIEPRLYHNNALLLPDARVLVMGGNNSRAARYDKDGTVRLDTKNDFAFVEKGTFGNSGEIWQHAIFYPPYLFGPSERPEIETNLTQLNYGKPQTISVSNASKETGSIVLVKLGSATHSFDNGQRLIDLKITNPESTGGSGTNITFNAPSKDEFVPPGYYMLFYVNSDGKPSHAKIVQLV